VIIPARLFEQYADPDIIRRHYGKQVKWIDHMCTFIAGGSSRRTATATGVVPPEDPKLIFHSKRPPCAKERAGNTGHVYFYHDLRLMSRYAASWGRVPTRSGR